MLRVFRAFVLLTYLLFLTIKEAVVAGGKFGTAGTWNPSGSPGATSDLQITGATTGAVEWTTAQNCRSLNCDVSGKTPYKGKLVWGAQLSIAPSATAPEGENKGIAVRLSSALELTGGILSLKGSPTEVLALYSAGHTWASITVEPTGASGYKLGDAAASSGAVVINKGGFDTNSQKLEAASLESIGESSRSLTLGTSTIKLTGTGVVWNVTLTGMTLSAASATIEFTGAEPIFYGGVSETTPKYGTVVMSGSKCIIGAAATGASKTIEVATLQLNATENSIVKLQAIRIGTTLTTNATSGGKKKLVSTEAGAQALLDLGGKTLTIENMEVRDIFVVSGTLNCANCVNLGNNGAEAGAHINFPSGALKGRIEATATAAAQAQASGVAKGSSTATASAAAKAQAPGVAKGSTAATAAMSARASAPGLLRGAWAATAALSGRPQAAGNLRGSSAASASGIARLQAAGLLHGVSAATAQLAARAQAPGALRGSWSASVTAAARLQVAGALAGASHASAALAARLQGSANAAGHSAATGGLHGDAQAQGELAGRFGTSAQMAGKAQAPGSASGLSEASAEFFGRAGAAGTLRGRIEVISEWFGKLGRGPEASRATVRDARVREAVYVNTRVRPVLDVSSRVRERVAVNVRLRGSGDE